MALAGVFAAIAAVLFLLGLLVTPVAVAVALPFGAVAYLLWYHASGRLEARIRANARSDSRRRRERAAARGAPGPGSARAREARQRRRAREGTDATASASAGTGTGRRRRTGGTGRPGTGGPTAAAAYRTLGLERDADQDAIREAYRERIKEAHPDRGGDEAEFQRIKRAYERLRDPSG